MDHNIGFYSLDNELKIVVYGINEQSQKLVRRFLSQKYEVLTYLDKRADELGQVDEIPVRNLDDFLSHPVANNICIIIALNNALQHDQIADALYREGYDKIIFVPMQIKYHREYAHQLRDIYNQILLGNIEQVSQIPSYGMLLEHLNELKDCILYENQDYLTVRVPADIVYSRTIHHFEKINRPDLFPVANSPLMTLKQYHILLDYLWGGKYESDNLQEYLNSYGVRSCRYTNSYTDQTVILQREQLYELWNEHFSEGMDFFIRSAPLAEWNDSGYFNLTDGHHRLCFLLKKGVYYLPVRISRQDWDKWLNSKVASGIDIKKEGVHLIAPISNPSFQTNSFYNKISIMESLLYIQKHLPQESYKGKTVLCVDNVYGYYGFHLRRMGAAHVIIYASNTQEKHAIDQLTLLYGLQAIEVIEERRWVNSQSLSLALVIGEANQQNDKHEMITKFTKGEIETLVISLSEHELERIDESIKHRLNPISKVFTGMEIQGIYLITYNMP